MVTEPVQFRRERALPYLLPVTYMAMSATSGLLIFLVRFPMGEPHWTAILKAFLLAGAVMLTWQEASQQVLRGRWCSYALALLAILSVLFSPVLIWLGDSLGGVLLYALLGTLWLIGLRRLATQISGMPIWDTLTAVLIGLTLGLAFFFIINTKGYASIFTPEQTLLGLQDRNTLYHTSLAAMLAKYGVPSTGTRWLTPRAVPFPVACLGRFDGALDARGSSPCVLPDTANRWHTFAIF